MNELFDSIQHDLLSPKALIEGLFYGVVFLVLATAVAAVIRRARDAR